MKIKLIINEPGYTLNILGKTFRTPTEIDIPEISLNDVVRILSREGIENYKFVKEPEKIKEIKSKELELIIEKDIKDNVKIDNKSDQKIEDILKQMKNLEHILNEIVKKEPTVIIQKDSKISKKKKEEEDEDVFIPSIDTSDLKIKKSKNNKRVVKKKDNSAKDIADSLKKYKK